MIRKYSWLTLSYFFNTCIYVSTVIYQHLIDEYRVTVFQVLTVFMYCMTMGKISLMLINYTLPYDLSKFIILFLKLNTNLRISLPKDGSF